MKKSIILVLVLFGITLSCQKEEVKSNSSGIKQLSDFLNSNGFKTLIVDAKNLNVLNVDVDSKDKLNSLLVVFFKSKNIYIKEGKGSDTSNEKTQTMCTSTTYWYDASDTLCQTFICITMGASSSIWTDCATSWD